MGGLQGQAETAVVFWYQNRWGNGQRRIRDFKSITFPSRCPWCWTDIICQLKMKSSANLQIDRVCELRVRVNYTFQSCIIMNLPTCDQRPYIHALDAIRVDPRSISQRQWSSQAYTSSSWRSNQARPATLHPTGYTN